MARRGIAPAQAARDHEDDAADDKAIVDPWDAARKRKVRTDPPHLRRGEQERDRHEATSAPPRITSARAAEQDRPDVAATRAAWREMQPHLDPERLVFVDETWASTNMARRMRRRPRGERVVAAMPHGHWKTSTFVAGLRIDGVVAPVVLGGPINGASVRAHVEQFLAPSLRPGDTVVIDNLGSHKVKGVREAIAAADARLLFLPPHSPDLNPIEQFFAKPKALLRTAARRTVDGLWNAISSALDAFSPDECRNYVNNCGYSHP